MKKLLLCIVLVTGTYPITWSQESTGEKIILTWSDEFRGRNIDTSKWEIPEYNRRNNEDGPDGWWSKADAYQDFRGNLVIRIRKIENRNDDNDAHDYSSAGLRTKGLFEQRYGRFEARCKLPEEQGWWVAFWMMQGHVSSTENGGIDGSEVDIMEGFGWTDKINTAVHWDGYGKAHQSAGHKTEIPGIRKGWHTYALDWLPEAYIFYIDGEEVWRTTGGGVCDQPGYIKLSGEISTKEGLSGKGWANDPEGANYPDHFKVDYVRVYQFSEFAGAFPGQ